MKTIVIGLLILFAAGQASAQESDRPRAEQYYSPKTGLALKGYDPVSYHKGRARKDSERITANHDGMQFYFISEAELVKLADAHRRKYIKKRKIVPDFWLVVPGSEFQIRIIEQAS